MAVGILRVFVAVLTMFVSRRRMLFGLLMLPVRMVVGRLMVMMSGSVMMSGCHTVMLRGRVLGLFCHSFCSPGEVWGERHAVLERGSRSAHP
jgi:hypothetical protein